MTASTLTLYAIVDMNKGKVIDVDYTLDEAVNFLLTADGQTFSVRLGPDGLQHLWRAAQHGSKPELTIFVGETENEVLQKIVDFDGDWDGYEAVVQTADSGWWKIAPHGGQALYRWGSRREAEEYAELLDDVEPTSVHHVSPISWREAFERQEYLAGDGYNLDDELQAIHEAA